MQLPERRRWEVKGLIVHTDRNRRSGSLKIKTKTKYKLLYDGVSVYASTNFQRFVGSLTKLYQVQSLFTSQGKYSKLGRIRKKSVEAYFKLTP